MQEKLYVIRYRKTRNSDTFETAIKAKNAKQAREFAKKILRTKYAITDLRWER